MKMFRPQRKLSELTEYTRTGLLTYLMPDPTAHHEVFTLLQTPR